MNEQQQTRLSKFLALMLRHRADEFGLRLDPEGFVSLDELLGAINRERGWEWVREDDIKGIIATQQKRRYEIVDGDIRAIYGHTLEAAISYPLVVPPPVLLHGTARRFVALIQRDGLYPMKRQYVHLTDDLALAQLTGKRRDSQPAIIRIDAAQAYADGVVFYRADQGVFLTKHIPAKYLVSPT
jgi:putative RNA 2'-phosphotransferase